jgi:hypothetical protein
VSVELMVEVLDHYHGPHVRKLWLIAWAEKVPKGSRAGYCKRAVLAARLGVSPARVSNIARDIEDEGIIKRLGGGVWGKTAEFELMPLADAQGNPRANPTQGNPRANPTGNPRANAQGNPRANAQGNARANPNPHNPQKPSSAPRRTTRTGSSGPPAATDDDDNPQTIYKPSPRTILDGLPDLDGEAELKAFIIAKLTATTDDPSGYLLELVEKGDGAVRRFLAHSRRRLAARARQADDDPDAERRRQSDGLMQFERDHPEAGP